MFDLKIITITHPDCGHTSVIVKIPEVEKDYILCSGTKSFPEFDNIFADDKLQRDMESAGNEVKVMVKEMSTCPTCTNDTLSVPAGNNA